MDLLYKIERKGIQLFVRLEQRGMKRVLYLDTLKAIAKPIDREPIALLVKIQLSVTRNLETMSFKQIQIPLAYQDQLLQLMSKTGRMIDESKPVASLQKSNQEKEASPPSPPPTTPTKPVEVPIEKPLTVFPKLVLRDTSGCFANLWMDYEIEQIRFDDFAPTVRGRARLKNEEAQWEKDLLEAGFTRKTVGDSHYYVSSEKVKEVLQLLLGLGWRIQDMRGNPIGSIELTEERGMIAIRSAVRGLIDPKIQMDGIWEGETLYVKRGRIGAVLPLLGEANWDTSLQKLAEGLKNGAVIETALPDPSFQGQLLAYQQKGVDWLQFLYQWGFSGLLADEMGLGKTVQVLAFLSRLGTNLPVLIVAPTSLLFNWQNEIARFLGNRPHIELVSYTSLRLNQESYSAKRYEVVVLDESNAIKTATTLTARAAYKLQARFKIALSGTPMENRLDELWSQFHFLMPNLLERNAPFETVKRTIAPFILRRRKEEVQLDLPEKIEQIIWVEMDEEQKGLYEMVRKGQGKETRMQILEAILRTRQVCCDPRLIGSQIPSAKMEQVLSDTRDALEQNRKVLIFSQFNFVLELIRKEFPHALLLDGSTSAEKRGNLVKEFQEKQGASLFLLSLKAGGVGLNLTAADYVFLFDPWWNDAVERQAIDRAHRIGTKNTIVAKRYLAIGTIEEKMLQLKMRKQQAADQLLDLEGWTEEDLLYLLE